MRRFFAPLLTLVSLASLTAADTPSVLSTRERLFDSRVSYLAESADNGVLVLNANNGFFDKGAFRAEGAKPVPADDKPLISSHFSHLVSTTNGRGSARWYIYIPTAGPIELDVYMNVTRSDVGQTWIVSLDGDERSFDTTLGTEAKPQGDSFAFRVDSPGKHLVSVRRDDTSRPSAADLYGVVLGGAAIKNASRLRARWRPAAVHTQYHSSTCPTTKTWVFESQNISDVSSYSPITTRFGYFGGSFDGNGQASGGINFSMWAASQKAKTAPPLDQMPHLLATGNPTAKFSGFGHEGSGVKIRNWEPYSHHPTSIIQALRVDTADGYDTYSGYLFDERTDRWVLYAVGRKPMKSQGRGNTPEEATTLRPASFCEVPGPPQVERTGDQRRTMRRRGWFRSDDGDWHPVDRQTVAIKAKDVPVNKFIGIDDEGWFVMGTGGMEMLDGTREVSTTRPSKVLPNYLQPDRAAQLFELPIGIGDSKATAITNRTATIEYDLSRLQPGATATVYYGSKDCLTFVSRELHGTEKKGLSSDMLATGRTWEFNTKPQPVSDGKNAFDVTNLKPQTAYAYRILVTDADGKRWADQSGNFETP